MHTRTGERSELPKTLSNRQKLIMSKLQKIMPKLQKTMSKLPKIRSKLQKIMSKLQKIVLKIGNKCVQTPEENVKKEGNDDKTFDNVKN